MSDDYFGKRKILVEVYTSSFGERLKVFRNAAGFTQKEAAIKLGKSSYTSVVMWETGKAVPRLEDFCKLCRLYATTPNKVLNFDDIEYQTI